MPWSLLMSSSERAAQDATDSQSCSESVAEHEPPKARPGYTFWHHYLAAVMQRRLDSPALEVRAFEKLGTLPLEADIIILRRRADVDLTGLAPDFEFLLKLLRDILVIEYKSPKDRLQLADLDTVRAYAMLCKRKFAARYDESVAVVMMYSSVDSDFFADCARNGLSFVETEPGVSACTDAAVKYYAVNLVEYGATRRSHPMVLFSSQHQQFRPTERELGLFQAIFEEVTYKELKHMAQSQYAVRPEGYEELHKWFLQSCTVEERLEGISVEERLRGLPAEERLRGLPTEEVLRSMTPEQRAQLRALLQRDPRS
jgi:hypothetical protein